MQVVLFSFFQDGLKAVENLKPSIEKLATDLHTVREQHTFVTTASSDTFFTLLLFLLLCQIKQAQDEERKQLTQLRDVLKTALQVEQKEVNTHLARWSVFEVWSVCFL